MWKKCVTSGFKTIFESQMRENNRVKRERKREREREIELQAEIKIMTGSPHQYTATPLCHPWQRTGLRHPKGQRQDRHRWPEGRGAAMSQQKRKKKKKKKKPAQIKKKKKWLEWTSLLTQMQLKKIKKGGDKCLWTAWHSTHTGDKSISRTLSKLVRMNAASDIMPDSQQTQSVHLTILPRRQPTEHIHTGGERSSLQNL